MLFHSRKLPPIIIDEFTAAVAQEALEWHLGSLADAARKARDTVDKPAYVKAKFERRLMHGLWSQISHHLEELGPAPPDAVAELNLCLDATHARVPRSAANEHILRAEREARVEVIDEWKVEQARKVEASRRMKGGKWARPRITVTGRGLEMPEDGELWG
ncbi:MULTISPECIES: hypothetical protein [unclassified Methylobacterium]|uniref:hypothetical protein n=1 Tax=unclassified Methylobacterium TaxID=2615210 RepID=UPI0036FA4619